MKLAVFFLVIIEFASAQFSQAAQNAIVKAHNDLRSAISKGNYVAAGKKMPPASNMLKMKWDPNLAASAQKYADTCQMAHSKWPGIGENIYTMWTPTLGNLDDHGVAACKMWEEEFQKFGWRSTVLDKATFESGIGHATQMAWAETNTIGCGVKNCGKDASVQNLYKIIVICQYKPPGNYFDRRIYKTGEACKSEF